MVGYPPTAIDLRLGVKLGVGVAIKRNRRREVDQFDEDIDPYGEHDMGRFTLSGEDYYWKIDHYDRNLEFHCNRESFCDWRSWARGAKGCAVSTSSNRES